MTLCLLWRHYDGKNTCYVLQQKPLADRRWCNVGYGVGGLTDVFAPLVHAINTPPRPVVDIMHHGGQRSESTNKAGESPKREIIEELQSVVKKAVEMATIEDTKVGMEGGCSSVF